MVCEKCGNPARQTLGDTCVSQIGLYKTVAYYCDQCDAIFIIGKYKDVIDGHKYDGELQWLRDQNPLLKNS